MNKIMMVIVAIAIVSCSSNKSETVSTSLQSTATTGHVIDTIYKNTISIKKDTMYMISKNDTLKYIDHMFLTLQDTTFANKFIFLHDTINKAQYVSVKQPAVQKKMSIVDIFIWTWTALIAFVCLREVLTWLRNRYLKR